MLSLTLVAHHSSLYKLQVQLLKKGLVWMGLLELI